MITVWALVYLASVNSVIFRMDFYYEEDCERAKVMMLKEIRGALGKGAAACIPKVRPNALV